MTPPSYFPIKCEPLKGEDLFLSFCMSQLLIQGQGDEPQISAESARKVWLTEKLSALPKDTSVHDRTRTGKPVWTPGQCPHSKGKVLPCLQKSSVNSWVFCWAGFWMWPGWKFSPHLAWNKAALTAAGQEQPQIPGHTLSQWPSANTQGGKGR